MNFVIAAIISPATQSLACRIALKNAVASELPEGELTKLRASLVCEKALHVFAQEIHLGDYLLLGKGEEHTGGRMRSSILADAFEAVIAAIYLDGGMEAAERHIMRFIPKNLELLQSLQNLRCNAVGTGGNSNPCHALHR